MPPSSRRRAGPPVSARWAAASCPTSAPPAGTPTQPSPLLAIRATPPILVHLAVHQVHRSSSRSAGAGGRFWCTHRVRKVCGFPSGKPIDRGAAASAPAGGRAITRRVMSKRAFLGMTRRNPPRPPRGGFDLAGGGMARQRRLLPLRAGGASPGQRSDEGVGQGHPLPRPVRAVYGPQGGPAWLREPHMPGSPARAPAAAAATVRHRAHANRSEAGQRQEPRRRASRGRGRPACGRAWGRPVDGDGRTGRPRAAHRPPPLRPQLPGSPNHRRWKKGGPPAG